MLRSDQLLKAHNSLIKNETQKKKGGKNKENPPISHKQSSKSSKAN